MKKYFLLVLLASLFFIPSNAQMSESGSLGVGLAWTSLNYGVSAKYNFTETHTDQVIVGSANYGFSFSGASSFSVTGRYSYNFDEGDLDFATWKPYLYGQVGLWTYKYDFVFLGVSESFNESAIALGAGGGIEWSFNNFIDGLTFSTELGYTNIAFDGLTSIGGFNWGGGIHYYFDL